MVTDSGEALLIDFAAAVKIDVQVQYSGALSHACIPVLEALARSDSNITFSIADELESLVHTVFTFISPHQLGSLVWDDIDENLKAAKLIEFWNYAMSPRLWQVALIAARAARYDQLTTTLSSFLS